MTKYESVLAQALELTEEERELLMIRVGLSLEDARGRPTEAEFLAHLQALVRHADAHPEESLDWEDAEREIFGD